MLTNGIRKIFSPAIIMTELLGYGFTITVLCLLAIMTIFVLELASTHNIVFQKPDLQLFSGTSALLIAYIAAGFYLHLQTKVQQLRKTTTDLAEGNFNHVVFSHHKHELDQLQNTLAQAAKKIGRMVTRVARTAVETHNGAQSESEIARTTAESSAKQSAAVTEIAAAIEQMTVSINHVAEQFKDIEHRSNQTRSLATDGETIIQKTTDLIRGISSAVQNSNERINTLRLHSADITQIIEVIKDIANQTNLLALNAAIEAARAGEHGRGFAVVSDEVRKLSIRTHEATEQVQNMITNIQNEIGRIIESISKIGGEVAGTLEHDAKITESFNSIKEGSNSIAESMHSAASAITEQSQVCIDISSTIESINKMSDKACEEAIEAKDTALYLETLSKRVLTILPDSVK